jgi:hypothetical protein
MITHYVLMLSLIFAVNTLHRTLGAHFHSVCLHLTTKHFSCAVIGAVELDISTSLAVVSGDVPVILAYLEL